MTGTAGFRPQPESVLLAQARDGHLACTRGPDLSPQFHANVRLTEVDRQTIFRLVLAGVLVYERYPLPHRFGVGQLLLTRFGRALLPAVPASKGGS